MVLASGIAGLLTAASAFAGAVVAELQGDVRAGATSAESRPVSPGQRVPPGSVVTTASGSRVILRFDDGQAAALHENTQLRIEAFRYRLQEPAADRAVFELVRGALRFVTGALGRRNPEAFVLRAPQVMIGIRGTDFMVAIANPAYLSVLQGAVTATNDAGTATFTAGAFGAIANRQTLAASLQAQALPGAVSSAFGSLGALNLAPAGSAGMVELPAQALPLVQDPGAFGRETAEKARELREVFDSKTGKEAAEAVRERARDLSPKSRARSAPR